MFFHSPQKSPAIREMQLEEWRGRFSLWSKYFHFRARRTSNDNWWDRSEIHNWYTLMCCLIAFLSLVRDYCSIVCFICSFEKLSEIYWCVFWQFLLLSLIASMSDKQAPGIASLIWKYQEFVCPFQWCYISFVSFPKKKKKTQSSKNPKHTNGTLLKNLLNGIHGFIWWIWCLDSQLSSFIPY